MHIDAISFRKDNEGDSPKKKKLEIKEENSIFKSKEEKSDLDKLKKEFVEYLQDRVEIPEDNIVKEEFVEYLQDRVEVPEDNIVKEEFVDYFQDRVEMPEDNIVKEEFVDYFQDRVEMPEDNIVKEEFVDYFQDRVEVPEDNIVKEEIFPFEEKVLSFEEEVEVHPLKEKTSILNKIKKDFLNYIDNFTFNIIDSDKADTSKTSISSLKSKFAYYLRNKLNLGTVYAITAKRMKNRNIKINETIKQQINKIVTQVQAAEDAKNNKSDDEVKYNGKS